MIPISTTALDEIIRIHKVLDERIGGLTAGNPVSYDPHASPESMKQEISHAAHRHDLSLLKVYEKYLSLQYTPHAIKKVLAALTGREDYDAAATLPKFYDAIDTSHLDAYYRVLQALGNGHPAWAPMAQAAAVHPESADEIVEYAVQGMIEPKEVVESIKSTETERHAGNSIVSVMDSRPSVIPTVSPITM